MPQASEQEFGARDREWQLDISYLSVEYLTCRRAAGRSRPLSNIGRLNGEHVRVGDKQYGLK
ncbi:hypothetical protein MAE02_23090 [Microvirga aerophila]|uniref:Uncharacterized protein n=1 Tax=Microvirga aerophila TaxID=670291 RepID=A0A512BRI7_9HYPH|nr:hypothetical protein MAE02_23090 [Microvirga aerophila]